MYHAHIDTTLATTRRWLRVLKEVARSFEGAFAVVVITIVVFLSLFASYVAPYDPDKPNMRETLLPPSARHFFGTDDVGRDIFSRVLQGVGVSVSAGCLVVLPSAIIGIAIGTSSGYCGRALDHVLMRITDMFIGFPPLILAIAVAAALGTGLTTGIIAIILIWWPGYARLSRSQVLAVKQESYVEAAHAMGCSHLRIALRHVLPNCYRALLVKTTFDIGYTILYIAALGFLGLGAQPPTPELGAMISVARHFIWAAPWYPLLPGMWLAVMVIGFNLFGEALSRVVERMKGSGI